MTENKRYIDDGFEAIEDQSFTDTKTDKTYYVDYFDEIVDLLNEQDKKIKELETVIQQILYKTRVNHTKEEYSIIVSVSPQMHDKLSNLIMKRMW